MKIPIIMVIFCAVACNAMNPASELQHIKDEYERPFEKYDTKRCINRKPIYEFIMKETKVTRTLKELATIYTRNQLKFMERFIQQYLRYDCYQDEFYAKYDLNKRGEAQDVWRRNMKRKGRLEGTLIEIQGALQSYYSDIDEIDCNTKQETRCKVD